MSEKKTEKPQPVTIKPDDRIGLTVDLAVSVECQQASEKDTGTPDSDTVGEEIELPPVLPIGQRHVLSIADSEEAESTQATVVYSDSKSAATTFNSPASFLPSIAGYQVHEQIGRGGMGVVYRATDLRLQRTVAIKLLPSVRNTPRARTRFESEARLLAQVDHPGVARIFEIATSGDTPYIAMEFVDGPSLDHFAGRKPLEPRLATEFVRQLAEALHACHALGIVHRDVKPSNALIVQSRQLKLTDFGLAKLTSEEAENLTRTGEIVGTPSYMAPEQASGIVREFGPETDVYGAGAVLYELLTGRPPFAAPDPMQTLFLVLADPPLSPRAIQPRVPIDLETITLKCLEKQKQHRYASAQDLADDLARFLNGEPIQARPVSLFRKTVSWVRRHPALSAVMGLLALGTVGTIWGIAAHNLTLQRELDRSKRLAAEGRDLSQWLLTDFSRTLESDQGLTFARSHLADRTQKYIDAIQRELSDDDTVKLALAKSLILLADLQGAPGTGSLGLPESAKANLKSAQSVLKTLRDDTVPTAVVLETSASLSLAAIEMNSKGVHFDPTDLFRSVREILEIQDSKVDSTQRNQLKLALLSLELQYAIQMGDQPASDRLVQEMDEIGQIILKSETEVETFVRAFSEVARARYLWLDRQNRGGEMIPSLKQGLEKYDRITKEQAVSLSTRLQITGIENLLGQAYYREGQYADAEEHFRKVVQAWELLLQRDSRNHGARFNLAQAWQSLGDAAMQRGDLDSVGGYLQQASKLYTEYAAHTGETLVSHPETLDLQTTLAHWHLQRGELDQARQEVKKLIDGLEPHLDRNWELRIRQADALLQLASIEMVAYADESEREGAQMSPDLKLAHDRAVNRLQEAIEVFELLNSEQELLDQAAGQLERARKMLRYVKNDYKERLESKQ